MAVFPTAVYIAPATRAATSSDSSTPWSSSLVALHGKAGNSTGPGRVWGPIAEEGRQVLHRVGNWLTSRYTMQGEIHGDAKTALWSEKPPKGKSFGVLQRHRSALVSWFLQSSLATPPPPVSTGFCVIWASTSSSSSLAHVIGYLSTDDTKPSLVPFR